MAEVSPAPPAPRTRPPVVRLLGRMVLPFAIVGLLGGRVGTGWALAIGGCVPLLFVGWGLVAHHRLDRAGLVALASVAFTGAVVLAFPGSATAVKMKGAVLPAVLGAVLLALAVGPAAWRVAVFRHAHHTDTHASSPARRQAARRLLALWGAGLLLEAAAHAAVALAFSTTTYLVLDRILRWGVLGALVLISGQRRRSHAA